MERARGRVEAGCSKESELNRERVKVERRECGSRAGKVEGKLSMKIELSRERVKAESRGRERS